MAELVITQDHLDAFAHAVKTTSSNMLPDGLVPAVVHAGKAAINTGLDDLWNGVKGLDFGPANFIVQMLGPQAINFLKNYVNSLNLGVKPAPAPVPPQPKPGGGGGVDVKVT